MTNKIQLFNEDWELAFSPTDSDDWDEVEWENVTLPHDWLIYDTNDLYKDSIGYYNKVFTVDDDNFHRHFLRFNGVYMECSIYINGVHIGDWKFGYTSFEFEISDYLIYGSENDVTVKVVHEPGNSRWYTGAGIYRDVYLISTQKTYIPYNGVYISPRKIDEDTWTVDVHTEIKSYNDGVEIKHTVEGIDDLSQVVNPRLWDIETPNLYTLITEVFEDGKIVYTQENTFGFREIAFDSENGFFLNGRHLKIQGVCQHHDLGALGAAFNKQALHRQFELLKEMGVNALRTAHNPPDPYFMQLADEMGFLVVSEIFDMWERPKTPKDYARFFNDWWEKDVESWVKRDRNHPSLIMWSVGNEVYDTHADPIRGTELLKMLEEAVYKYDPNKNAYVTIGSNYLPWENTQKVADTLKSPKLVGYNYGEYLYKDHHTKYKDWIMYGSETGSVVQSRGIYHFPLSQSVLADDDEQCSSLGNSATSWGAKSTESCIIIDRDTPFSLGQFIWTGTDYIGEPTPYHTKNSYFGQIDTAGFKKDSFYIYKSAWTDYKKVPFVHIFPYWDFSPSQMIDVCVVSNAPKVELFFNGVSQGVFERGEKIVGTWRIPYEKGELKTYAYNESDEIIATATQVSFGDVAEIRTDITKKENIAFAEIYAVDSEGEVVHNANNRINITVRGGNLMGLDNGDSTDYDQYKADSKRLFSGKLLAIVEIENDDFEIITEIDKNDIPVRKIELLRSNTIDKEKRCATIKAIIHPANSTYKDLIWRVTDAAGIDTNVASFEVSEDGTEITLTAKGDGEIFVRCCTKNGRDRLQTRAVSEANDQGKISLISYLDFSVEGLGKAYLNPYEFIAGGLYNKSNLPMTNGNDRGVATLRDGESHVGFADIDFGEIGADEIHLPIFAMSQEEFPIEIWEGMPEENGTKICEVTYKSGSIWNTYTTETYKLPYKLKGITCLSFAVKKKIHIKGFSFTQTFKAYEQLNAAAFTNIYGDSFKIEETNVTGIGNNVTLEFTAMDFDCGTNATKSLKLLINGKGKIDNTIHLKFDDGPAIVLEFPKSTDYITKEFNIEVQCEDKVSFVFMPGSNFDFAWFKFM